MGTRSQVSYRCNPSAIFIAKREMKQDILDTMDAETGKLFRNARPNALEPG
jgi:hypothetical protein